MREFPGRSLLQPEIRRAIKEIHRISPAAGVHVAIRAALSPLCRVLDAVPRDGRALLDFGAGYGLSALTLHYRDPARKILVCDADPRKAGVLDGLARRHPSIRRVACLPRQMPAAEISHVLVQDVLYLMPGGIWRDLVAQFCALLPPRGRLVISNADTQPRWKHRWNQVAETLTVQLLGLTHGEQVGIMPSATLIDFLRAQGLQTRRIDARGYPVAYTIIIGENAG